MGAEEQKNALVKRLIKQITGNLTEDDELIPESAIKGIGDIWCWDPMKRTVRKISRGIKVYVLQHNFDHQNRALVYTLNGDMVCVEPEELLHTGYD